MEVLSGLQHLGGFVSTGGSFGSGVVGSTAAMRTMKSAWMRGEQALVLHLKYNRKLEITSRRAMEEVVDEVEHVHQQLNEGEVLVVMVRIDTWDLNGGAMYHRAILFIGESTAWLYDPLSFVESDYVRTQVTEFKPMLEELLRPMRVELLFTAGEADVARQGQTTADGSLCNSLCLVAAVAVAFAGIEGGPSSLRLLQGISAKALADVAMYALPEVWANAMDSRDNPNLRIRGLLPCEDLAPRRFQQAKQASGRAFSQIQDFLNPRESLVVNTRGDREFAVSHDGFGRRLVRLGGAYTGHYTQARLQLFSLLRGRGRHTAQALLRWERAHGAEGRGLRTDPKGREVLPEGATRGSSS
jgi:hypothetical protein